MAATTREMAKISTRARIIPAREAGEGHESALGREEAAAGQFSGRRVFPDADLSGDPELSEGAHGLVGRLPDLREPEGLRRAVDGPVRPRDAGDHTVRRCSVSARRCGGSGACLRPSAARQRRGSRGFEGGRSLPRQSPVYVHWVGWPTTLTGQPALAIRLRMDCPLGDPSGEPRSPGSGQERGPLLHERPPLTSIRTPVGGSTPRERRRWRPASAPTAPSIPVHGGEGQLLHSGGGAPGLTLPTALSVLHSVAERH